MSSLCDRNYAEYQPRSKDCVEISRVWFVRPWGPQISSFPTPASIQMFRCWPWSRITKEFCCIKMTNITQTASLDIRAKEISVQSKYSEVIWSDLIEWWVICHLQHWESVPFVPEGTCNRPIAIGHRSVLKWNLLHLQARSVSHCLDGSVLGSEAQERW